MLANFKFHFERKSEFLHRNLASTLHIRLFKVNLCSLVEYIKHSIKEDREPQRMESNTVWVLTKPSEINDKLTMFDFTSTS